MKFSIQQATRQGRRSSNQDRLGIAYSREALLMVVADGMGGHPGGEVAAQIALNTLIGEFRKLALPRLAAPERFLDIALLRAHHAINAYAGARGQADAPRTTCVAALVQDARAWWAHAGDSRLYCFSAGELVERTEDHSPVARLVREGALTEAQAGVHPERNRVSSCLGGLARPEIASQAGRPLAEGDLLLLCSDGFWGPLANAELRDAFAAYALADAVGVLMDRAEYRGGEHCDNLSLVAMRWGEARAPGAVSTLALARDDVATELGATDAPGQELTEDEIERAIAEIRRALNPPGTP